MIVPMGCLDETGHSHALGYMNKKPTGAELQEEWEGAKGRPVPLI